MISEPEMSDGPGGGLPSDLLSSSDDPATATTATTVGRRTRPWLWAIGGIVVASAVWAAVLHGTGGTGPDLHGYHLGGNPCTGDVLNPLRDAVGKQDFTASNATVSKGPALDRLSCVLTSGAAAGDGWVTTYTIRVGIELHKKTDPRAEFENTRQAQVSHLPAGASYGSVMIAVADSDFTSAAEVHPVTGVGDEAYLLAPHGPAQTLEVLHGGAVLTLQISGYTQWNSTSESDAEPGDTPKDPDLTHFRPAMTTAMHHLMTSLAS